MKCVFPTTTSQTITNNITNNITNDNSTNITNNIITNIIRVDFGKESLNMLCEDEHYLENMRKHISLGKYAIPKSIEEIYFNDKFPEYQTLKKERRNDKMVCIQHEGKWETRMFDDLYKDILIKIERYHNKYFRALQIEHEETERDNQFRKLMLPLRRFSHQMLWFGWNCNEIRKIGLDLNYPDDDEEMKRKTKSMTKIMLEKIYEKTDT